MKINELNYELYALDYVEGQLTGEDLKAMEFFLSQHPQLKEEILAICAVELPFEEIIYNDKSSLYRKEKATVSLRILLSMATAACLVLLVGFMWMKSQPLNYGQMAVLPQFYIDNEVALIKVEKGKSENAVSQNKSSIERIRSTQIDVLDIASNLNSNKSNKNLVDNTNIEVTEIEDNSISTAMKRRDIENNRVNTIVENNQQINDIKIEANNISIIETTIEIGALQNNLNYDISAMVEKKEERKKEFRENIKYVFQNALLPEGLAVAINN